MARRAEYLEQFPAGLVKSGPGYLVPGSALTRAENVRLDQTATLRRTFGHVNDGEIFLNGRTAGLYIHNDEGTKRKLGWHQSISGGIQLFEDYMDVTVSAFWGGPGTGDPWASTDDIRGWSVHALSADNVVANSMVKYDGTNIRNVGVSPPSLAVATAVVVEPKTEQIDSMDSGWGFSSGSHSAVSREGSGSAVLAFRSGSSSENCSRTIIGPPPETFSVDGSSVSQDDYVVLWVISRIAGGGDDRITRRVRSIKLEFSRESGFTEDVLSRELADQDLQDVVARAVGNGLNEWDGAFSWVPIFFRISDFLRSGSDQGTDPLWDLRNVRITVGLIGTPDHDVYIDDLEFWGGYDIDTDADWSLISAPVNGFLGEAELISGGVEVAITFENENGSESSGTEFDIEPLDPIRGAIEVAGLGTGDANDGNTTINVYLKAVGIDTEFKLSESFSITGAPFIVTALGTGQTMPTDNNKPPGARYIAEYRDHLFAAATSDSEREFIFSKPGSGWEAFPGPAERLDDDLTGLASMAGGLALFTRSSLWYLTGSGLDDFVISKIEGGRGCVAPRSIAVTPAGVIYLARDGLYLFNGSVSRPVSSRVRGIFEGTADITLNQSAVDKCVAAWDTRRLRYVLTYPSGSATKPDRVLVLWAEHGWAATEETWSADYLTYDRTGGDLYIAHPAASGTIRVSVTGDQSDDFDGSSVTWDVETAEVASQPPARHLRKHYDAVWTEHAPATATIEVDVRIDEQDPPVSSVVTSDWRRSSDPRIMHRHKVSGSGLRASVRARGEGELDSLRFILLFEDEAAQ